MPALPVVNLVHTLMDRGMVNTVPTTEPMDYLLHGNKAEMV